LFGLDTVKEPIQKVLEPFQNVVNFEISQEHLRVPNADIVILETISFSEILNQPETTTATFQRDDPLGILVGEVKNDLNTGVNAENCSSSSTSSLPIHRAVLVLWLSLTYSLAKYYERRELNQ
jgi:hypothetical protein